MPSTRKKVLVRTRRRELHRGYLDPEHFQADGFIHLLSPSGQLLQLSASEIKAIYFVHDFTATVVAERRSQTSRPRLHGLWIRITYDDHETFEGILANNLVEMDGGGFLLTPPTLSADFQKVWIPRQVVSEAVVLGVIGGQRRRERAAVVREQIDLFFGDSAPVSS